MALLRARAFTDRVITRKRQENVTTDIQQVAEEANRQQTVTKVTNPNSSPLKTSRVTIDSDGLVGLVSSFPTGDGEYLFYLGWHSHSPENESHMKGKKALETK